MTRREDAGRTKEAGLRKDAVEMSRQLTETNISLTKIKVIR